MLEQLLSRFGYTKSNRITGGLAVTDRTFDTSDDYDMPIGIGGMSDRTLSQMDVQKLNKLMNSAYMINPLISFPVDLCVRMTVGEKPTVTANKLESDNSDEAAKALRLQAVLDRFWNHELNRMSELLPQIQEDAVKFGELIPFYRRDPAKGNLYLSFIPVDNVVEWVYDDITRRQVKAIKIRTAKGEEVVLNMIEVDAAGLQPALKPEVYGMASGRTVGRLVGDISYWALNRGISQQRGHGDFIRAIKPANDIVKLTTSITDRTQINNLVVSEIIFPPNTQQSEINEMLTPGNPKYINPPNARDRVSRLFGHTENIKFNFVTTSIPASENETTINILKGNYLTAVGMPQHWVFGQGENANKASAQEMADPVFGYLQSRQTAIVGWASEACRVAIDTNRIFTSDLDGMTDEEFARGQVQSTIIRV